MKYLLYFTRVKVFQNLRNTDEISVKSDYFPTYQPKIYYHTINKSTY